MVRCVRWGREGRVCVGEVSARRQEIARFALQYHLSKETAGVDCGPRLCDFETLR